MTTEPHDRQRFFEPGSKIWQVNREIVLLAAGGRALLMQLAHPKVAAGVAEHSRFQDDPFGRLYRTMSAMWSIVFDEHSEAEDALERVESIHKKVHGIVPDSETLHAGARYDAFDQDLLLWVHATLIDSAMVAYDHLVAPLPVVDRKNYYSDSRKLARLFGIPETIIPSGVTEFEQYMKQMLNGDMIAVGPTARSLARDILYARPWLFKPAGPLFRFVTAGLLPDRLRHGYELNWSTQKDKMFLLLARAIRSALPLVPSPLRIVPNARAAENAFRRQSRAARQANE
jgi:uncharacterized protein (DUF2236 family)